MPASPKYSDPEVLAQLQGLSLRARHVVEGVLAGQHRSPFRGANVEFAEYREYSPGDDLRRLDWRVYGRSDRYFIKQYEEESNLRCTFVVDGSASMQYGSSPLNKFDYACVVAVALASLLLRQQDAVGLVLCDEVPTPRLHPVATPGQLSRMAELLENTQPAGKTALGESLSQLPDQLAGRGMVVVLSDLFTAEQPWLDALARLRFRGHEVLVMHVLDRDELELPFRDPVVFQDMEGTDEIYAEPWVLRQAYQDAVAEFIERMRSACHQHRADYVLLRTDEALAGALSQFLHHRSKRAVS